MKTSKKANIGMTIVIALLVVIVIAVIVLGVNMASDGDSAPSDSLEDGEKESAGAQNEGDAATLAISAYTGSWGDAGAKTEVYPAYTVLDEDKVALINDAQANSTDQVVVGSLVDIYGTGAAYYVTPEEGVEVAIEKDAIDLDAFATAATTDLVITMYNSDDDVLTADDNSNNTADYAGGNLAASDVETFYAKIEQTGADKTLNLNAICTWIVGDELDDFELDESGWVETNAVPETLGDASITMYDDSNNSASEKGFVHCYERTESLMLHENDDTGKLKFLLDTDDSNAPTANGDSYFGFVILDGSYSTDKEGNIAFGSWMDDDTEDPGTVGIDENADTTFNGLDTAVAIEAQ